MKQTVKKLLKSGICLMLVFCMLLSFAPATALTAQAAQDEQDTLIYVSIGDSMTNGYCLPGYDGVSGAINYAMETYSNKFAAYLADYDGPVVDNQVIFKGDKRTVDHRQLAISGMRAQDVQWILELNYLDDALIQDLYDNNDYKKDFNYSQFSSKWYGDWKFNTAGDFFTYSELIDSKYRYADAAARIVTTYFDEQGDGFEYYESEKKYNEAVPVDTIVAGVAAEPAYPQGAQEAAMGANYLRIATEFYQKSMADADIISLGVGNTNFGTFMLNKITNLIMGGDMSFSQNYDINKAIIQAKSNPVAWEKVKAMVGDPDNNWAGVSQEYQIMEYAMTQLGGGYAPYEAEIQYILKYAMITFMSGYIGMLDAILELNPDAQIIMIALMNSYAEDNGTTEGTVSEGTLGELVQYIYTPVNAFLKNLAAEYDGSHEYAKFYFAEAPYVSCMVDVFGDDYYKDVNGNFVEYKGLLNERDVQTGELLNPSEGYTANVGGVVRERFAEEILKNTEDGGYFFPNIKIEKTVDDIRPFLYGDEVTFTVEGKSVVEDTCGVIAYDMMTPVQKVIYAASNPNSAQEYGYYLAFENALIVSGTKNITMDSLAGLGDIAKEFGNSLESIKAAIAQAAAGRVNDALDGLAFIMESTLKSELLKYKEAAEKDQTQTQDESAADPMANLTIVYDVDVDVTGEEIYGIIAGGNPPESETDPIPEARANAAGVIADNVVKEVYVATVIHNAYNGIDTAFDTIIKTLKKELGKLYDSLGFTDVTLSSVDYYNFLNGTTLTELTDDQKKELVIAWGKDGYNIVGDEVPAELKHGDWQNGAYANLFAYLDARFDEGMGELVFEKALNPEAEDQTAAESLELLAGFGLQLYLGDEAIKAGIADINEKTPTLTNARNEIVEQIGRNAALKASTLESLCSLLALPSTLSYELNANEKLQGALTMNARCLVGTGAGAHPSTDGHQALYKAVFDAFDFCSLDGHTPVHGTPEVIEGLTHGKIVCDVCDEPIEEFIYGDVNGDGKINTSDLGMLRAHIANTNPLTGVSTVQVKSGADCNGDGKINTSDLGMLRAYIANTNPITGVSSVVMGPQVKE